MPVDYPVIDQCDETVVVILMMRIVAEMRPFHVDVFPLNSLEQWQAEKLSE
jgi:hypothetical protein